VDKNYIPLQCAFTNCEVTMVLLAWQQHRHFWKKYDAFSIFIAMMTVFGQIYNDGVPVGCLHCEVICLT